MPTYDYRCPEGHEFDRFFRKISDAVSELPCPVCGKTATRYLSAGAGFVFKGSGFYLTDYGKNAHRKSGESKPDKSGGAESSANESKNETKSETRSESKPAESAAAEKSHRSDKPEKSDRSEKSDKSARSDKSASSDKPPSKNTKAGE